MSVGLSTPVHAAPLIKITMPSGPKPTVNGLALSLDCSWGGHFGYQPIRLDVVCAPPSTSDRALTVQLATGNGASNSMAVTAEVEIPAGSTRVSQIISFPQYAPFYNLSLDVWEDGVHIDDLSFKNRYFNGNMVYQADQPALLFVTSGVLDVSQLDFLADPNSNNWNTRAAGLGSVAQAGNFTYLPADDLVENWINYDSLDVICISLDDVTDLAANSPRVWQALRRWVSTGGNLCVYGVGQDWHGLAPLEDYLACPGRPDAVTSPKRGWQQPLRDLFNKQVRFSGTSNTTVELEVAEEEATPRRNKKQALKPPEADPFVFQDIKLGQVFALASDKPFPGQRTEWQWLFDSIGPARWKWQYRHGLSPLQGNPGFDEFLIADIGLPPVKSYRVLITLFVIGIGPLNYWLLYRRGRLHLLLFTVPAAALLVSVGLIGYVLVADGLQSRARSRSYMELDQRNHEAVCWSRLSYYTALAPSVGLQFPADTAIAPLEKVADWNGWGRTRYLTWTPEQHLQRGWLASRTPTQYLAVRACATPSELRIAEPNGTNPCAVENRLGTKIKQLILCDSSGNLHYAQNIDPRGKAALQPLDSELAKSTAFSEVQQMLSAEAPRLPSQAPSSSTRFFFGIRINNSYRYGNNNGDVSTSQSLLESGLRRVFSMLNTQDLGRRTYVAVVERPPEVTIGMEGLIENHSTHVILGTW